MAAKYVCETIHAYFIILENFINEKFQTNDFVAETIFQSKRVLRAFQHIMLNRTLRDSSIEKCRAMSAKCPYDSKAASSALKLHHLQRAY